MVAPALEVLNTAAGGSARLLVPAPLSGASFAQLQEAAVTIYDALGCAGVVRVDFVLTDAGPVLNRVNTTPGLTPQCQVPRMFAAAGIAYPKLLDLLISDARRRAPGRPLLVAR
jgi:D-alanine-D-alanine ligase